MLYQRGQTDCPLVIRKPFLSTQPMALRNVGVGGSELPTPWHTLAEMKKRATSAKNVRRPNFKSYPFYLRSRLNHLVKCAHFQTITVLIWSKSDMFINWLPSLASQCGWAAWVWGTPHLQPCSWHSLSLHISTCPLDYDWENQGQFHRSAVSLSDTALGRAGVAPPAALREQMCATLTQTQQQ